MLVVSFMAAGFNPVMAQDDNGGQQSEKKEKKKSKFGSFIRKVGEATTGINMSDELITAMPMELKMHLKVSEVTAVGDPATGSVLVTVTVVTSEDARLLLGQTMRKSDKAVDSKGKEYVVDGIWQGVDGQENTHKGIAHAYQYVAYNYPADEKQIELLPLDYGYYASGYKTTTIDTHENIQLRNIDIEWKAE